MSIGEKVFDLSDYDDHVRDQILDGLRRRSVNPYLYGALLWLGGWYGLHHWYRSEFILAVAQLGLVTMAFALCMRGGLEAAFSDVLWGVGFFAISGVWWLYDLNTQKRALMNLQYLREQSLLRVISNRFKKEAVTSTASS